MPQDSTKTLTRAEREDVEELSAPRAPVIYEVVRREGEEELRRPNVSLFWSGVAAGLAIMVSIVAQSALRQKLPADLPWRDVVTPFGYSVGFLIVIHGRMQLFTEQTVVAVLPLMAAPSWLNLRNTGRLWGIVLAANLIGTAAAAAIHVNLHLVGPELRASMIEVSAHLLHRTQLEMVGMAVPAGFIIASIAWIRAAVSDGAFWIVLTLTYAIALGEFTHVVAGSAEAFLLLFAGTIDIAHAFGGIIVPALIGNIIGGTGLFALLAYAQVREEL